MIDTPETDETTEAEATEATDAETTEAEEAPPNRAERRGARLTDKAIGGVFTQASDQAAKPGFRNKANKNSKAQAKSQKKRKKSGKRKMRR